MMRRSLFSPLLLAAVGTAIVLCSLPLALAQVMESNNYRIQSDSVNFGGGLSSSTNYMLESTAGEVASGDATSTSYALRAGFQQMQEVYIALSGAANVLMSPSIPGVSGGVANGSTTVTVTTDSPSGYALTIASQSSPAMQKDGDTIADYVPAGDPDFTFVTGSADAHFGYSPEGVDTVQRFLDNGAACNAGSLNTAQSCWDGLSTSQEVIASDTGSNHPNGATTTVQFRVGVGGAVLQAPGLYTATTTITAVPL